MVNDPLLPYITLNLSDGTTAQILKPSHREIAAISDELTAQRRTKMIENAKASGLVSEQFFAELEGFDRDPPDEIKRGLNTHPGRVKIFLRIAEKNHKPEEAENIIDKMVDNLLQVIAPLFGYSVDDPAARPKEGETPDGPLMTTGNPASYENQHNST